MIVRFSEPNRKVFTIFIIWYHIIWMIDSQWIICSHEFLWGYKISLLSDDNLIIMKVRFWLVIRFGTLSIDVIGVQRTSSGNINITNREANWNQTIVKEKNRFDRILLIIDKSIQLIDRSPCFIFRTSLVILIFHLCKMFWKQRIAFFFYFYNFATSISFYNWAYCEWFSGVLFDFKHLVLSVFYLLS